MNAKRLFLLTVVALPLMSMVFIACAATTARGLQPDGTLAPCPSSPNCVCSESDAASIAPLGFSGDPDSAFQSLIEFLRSEPRVELTVVEAEYAHAIFKTKWMRFRDDLELRLDRDAQAIHVRSASRLGYSDLGANERRVESIRKRWTPPQ